jgi:hypothetical protein
MRAKHYYTFEEDIQNKMKKGILNKDNWDILRTDVKDSPFSIEKDISSYEKNCMSSLSNKSLAELLCQSIESQNYKSKKIISLGAGKGILEWHMKKRMPLFIVECTDYTEKGISQLKEVFLDLDDAYVFDMLGGNYSDLDVNAIFIMHRVSTEFNIDNWYKIFLKMYEAGIERIIFIPTGLDTLKTMLAEKKAHIKNILYRKKDIFCGWLYSEKEFLKIFHGKGKYSLYEINEKIALDDTMIYFLKRNKVFR